jgi:transposase
MIDQDYSTGAPNLVAIDIAKDWNVALVQDASGQRHRFKFANRAADHNRFVQFLRSLTGLVRIGLEPTGDYHRPIAYRLLTEGFQVVSISSLALARFREARFGNWDKNDPKDAQVMLAMMAQGFVQVYYDPLFSGSHDWQELSNTYFQITLARTRLQHSLLSHHLPLYFPEFTRYWLSTRSEWFIRFLIRFPTPAAIRALDREDFIAEAWDLIGRKVSKQAKLEEMYTMAGKSIGLTVPLPQWLPRLHSRFSAT